MRCPVHLQKRFLRNVKACSRVTNLSQDELHALVLILDDQEIKRRTAALLHASDQREVRGSATGSVSVGLLCQTLLGRPHAPPNVRPRREGIELVRGGSRSWNDSNSVAPLTARNNVTRVAQ